VDSLSALCRTGVTGSRHGLRQAKKPGPVWGVSGKKCLASAFQIRALPSFERMGLSKEYQEKLLQEQIAE
jgi:hypothetical protein